MLDKDVGLVCLLTKVLIAFSGTTGLTIDTYPIAFTSHTLASSVFPSLQQFSLVLDCTDNAQTRYLISDACAASGTTLVSGAAIRTDGQLSIWNLPLSDGRGPCYRCIFPEPIEERLEQRCEDEGVLGPIVGLVGVLMALEALQLLTHTHGSSHGSLHLLSQIKVDA